MGEQLKEENGEIPCPLCNPMDAEQTLRAKLLRESFPNWPWLLQEVLT